MRHDIATTIVLQKDAGGGGRGGGGGGYEGHMGIDIVCLASAWFVCFTCRSLFEHFSGLKLARLI